MTQTPTRLLIAASGTGGHLFPALAVAEQLKDYEIEWLGVPDRLEQTLVPKCYPLHTIPIEGFQTRLGFKTLQIFFRQIAAIFQVQQLLKQRKIDAVFSTGGYIAGPTILAARLQNIPVILHESNSIPGKVTTFLGPFCNTVALGFPETAKYLKRSKTLWLSTPVRSQFLAPQPLDLDIQSDVPLIVVVGGSQGAVALNRIVRQCAAAWLAAGAYIVHLTGENDPEANILKHPHYISLPFYENMAGLLQRATLAVSRSGSGTLTELAVTKTPSILIPYPFAAEDHQFYNAKVFADADAAYLYRQDELSSELLEKKVLELLASPQKLDFMATQSASLAYIDSAERLANLIRNLP
ncbi:undecaprenyldiphospho-muramoylpentapeptide beta-N-acetylglucosaminyltransferase [Aphanothece hegewaldii CCALA 016]|uniref:UDP-N-acetylglucosamine--N-acetylmuramyl-(pentapeptide) pyrophosphoryl-undecaprenol N-acetylglucosamine transferase n=1 Tax=Aphanothece hegewaldii CCALA 016 TaxID=2107694 RepID=A0A2T1LY39_9CHRO|nr:undecaprenyldiphospho-muramoylpentapeptide beta-N-acetylglucosaminyltransferase [Aphanothece hegewaldii]PSF37305.1 undecaprenyldiphospho-muramoylpentapeptide beta-N-acetylglucosaminyltransferase [Aphanothece hegewaldii CCALA 016]